MAARLARRISIPGTLSALLLFGIAGCSGGDPTGPALTIGTASEVPPNAQVVAFDIVQEMTTEISGITDRRRDVIADQAEWEALWDGIQTFVVPKPPAPEIDFGNRMVIFASMGERTSGGHTIAVLEAAQENGSLYVVVEEATPGIQCMTTDVVTTPAVAVSVPRTGQSVLFVDREIAYPCAPM
jgi:hypothetical protein